MAEYQGMTPTVVIGLGGTGKEILIKIRRMIVETYGSLDALPIVSFLHIDTEQNAKCSEPQVVLKQDISLRPVEQVWAKVENAKTMLNKLSDYNYLVDWFPSQLKGTDSILAGAGQIRALGKFAFTVNYPPIKTSFENAQKRIIEGTKLMDRRQVQIDKGINIFVVCSLSGGTGSGMFLDLAYNLRDWVPAAEQPQTSAYLVLPGAFAGLGDRVIANAYAALMELNHYSRSDTRFEAQYQKTSDQISSQSGQDVPFSFCYLLGNSNDKVTLPTLESMLEMVAQNIFLDFSSGFSPYKKLVRDNIRKQWAAPDTLGYPQNFITFGLSSIQFPVERVRKACAFRLANRVVSWWANPTPVSTSMRDVVKTEILPSLQLIESDKEHQILDSISLSDNSKTYSLEVSDWVAGVKQERNQLNVKFEVLQNFLGENKRKYDPHFEGSDDDPKRWSDYYKKMWDNLNRLIPQKRQQLRETVYRMVEDRFRGSRFTRQFLETLREVFAEYRSQFEQDRSQVWLDQETKADKKFPVLSNQINTHAKEINPFNKKSVVDKDFEDILVTLKDLYVAKIEVKSRVLGVRLIDSMTAEIEQLLVDIAAYERTIEELQLALQEHENTYIRETGTLTVNGILLYDPKVVDQVYNEALGGKEDNAFQAISQKVLGELKLRLLDMHTFSEDFLRKQDLFNRLVDLAFDELAGRLQIKISAARQFLQEYPTLQEQEARIKTTFEKSEPFVRFSQEQAGVGWDDIPEKRQKLVGIEGGNKPTDPAVVIILPMLRKASTLTDKDIRPLNDPHSIYFVQEVGAFPLRLIEGMDRMRTVYRSVSQSDKNPLHTHQDNRRFQDPMPAPEHEVKVKHNLILGIVLELLTEVENKATGFHEVRFAYKDKQTGLEKTHTFGANWQEAEEYLLSDSNRKVREILNDAIESIAQKAVTKLEKKALYQKVMTYLERLENTLLHGKDNPEHKKAESAIEEFVKNYDLFIPPSLSDATSSDSTPLADSISSPQVKLAPTADFENNLEKFKKLAQTCHSCDNPSVRDLQTLERFRQKYAIPQELADRIIAEIAPQNYQQEYALMYRAFLDNDGEIGVQQQAELLDLQEELGLTNEQVTAVESRVRKELGLNK
jgi:hypothetical protein